MIIGTKIPVQFLKLRHWNFLQRTASSSSCDTNTLDPEYFLPYSSNTNKVNSSTHLREANMFEHFKTSTISSYFLPALKYKAAQCIPETFLVQNIQAPNNHQK